MKNKTTGLTLMELLMALTILAIGTSIAVPSITRLGRIYNTKRAARELKTTFNQARMEAIKLNTSVTVVFNQGNYDYLVFIDSNNSCEYDAESEAIIKRVKLYGARFDTSKAGGDGLSFVKNDNNRPAIRWNTKGLPMRNGTGFGSGTAYIKGPETQYRVIVSKIGNTRISKY